MQRAICYLLVVFSGFVPRLAAGELVVVVNAASGVESLTREQVVNIFLGRFRQFPSGLPAEPIDQPEGSPLKARFYRALVGKEVVEINAYWARLVFSGRTAPPLKTENADEVLRQLYARNTRIAYVDRSQVDARVNIVFVLGHAP